ncbi:MAG: TRAP transporter substrate-binding protein [Rhodobacteraceae bacterium]|nr:TRAP transporter substrate-binding protein [Paracoccaceae bacterium]
MNRREILTAAATTVAVPAALATPALAQGVMEWKYPTSFPANAPGVGTNATSFAARVNAMAEGRLQLKIFSSGDLVPPFAVEDAVQQGTAEIGHSTPYYNAGKNPALHFFTTAPFGLSANEQAAWLRYGGGQELWDEIYAERDLIPLYSGNSSVQAAGWFRKEINSVADLQGLNMRIAGLGGEAMRKLGVNAVLLPPPEIFPSFQSGAIDAAEWVGPMLDQAFGLNKITNICYAPAFHEPSAALEVIVNKDAWDSLTPDLQAILRSAAEACVTESLSQFEFFNAQAFAQLKETGVEFRTFPPEVIDALKGAVAEVMEEQAAASTQFARVKESYDAFLALAIPYADAFTAPSLTQRG